MQCSACGHLNPADAAFCMRCGAALATACRQCATPLPPDAAFCPRCGTPAGASPAAAPPALPTAPTAFVNGRYAVVRFLGEGGKKRVYLVHDSLLDREVAFALLKTEGLDAAGRDRVVREARTMGRLGGHPHIVSVHDLGEEAGHPYLVSEYLAGGDLETRIAQTPDQRLPLDQALRIAGDVLAALEHAHAHGVVHRDLKPGNVWLTRDGRAKLGDFGLALAIDTTRRSLSGMIVGTVGYMAPEQALGRTPDPRSDLYSFGALLYELVTGRPPFQGDDPVAVIGQHINTQPVAPSWHNPYVPKPLEALILRLLEKDPAARPERAAAVRRELAAVTVLAGSPYRAEQQASGSANPLDRLAGSVFVGRERELELLRGAFDAALAGRAGIALLAGEPGIGKTTLAEETATYARLRGAQVYWGRCYEWEGAPAYWPWVQILRAYAEQHDAERLRAELGAGATQIAQIAPEVRALLPDLPEAPRLEGEQARFRLFDAIAGFLRASATHQPLLLVLDDLHWADTPSLLLLQFVVRELADAPFMLIGAYRDIEVDRRHPLSTTLADLSRGHGTQRIPLHGLTTADIARLIALSTGSEPEAALVQAVQRETEGNPFFVSEVVRLLVAEGRLGRAGRPLSWSVSIPESVRDVVGRRLDRLSDACNALLAMASVVGREFSLPVLTRVSERALDDVLDALEEAVRARLVQEEATAQRYRFTHALVQDTLYGELSAARRLRLHAAVGHALEQVYAADPAPHYGELAHHFAIAAPAGHATEAVRYAVKAGERAMAQFAWELAAEHYERALQSLDLQPDPSPGQRCDTLLALGAAQYYTVLDVSDSPGGQASYLRAAEIAQTLGSFERLARAALGYAGINVARTAGGLQQVRLLEAALGLAPTGDSALKARLMARLAVDYRVTPQMAERIEPLSAEALAMARRLGDPAVLAPVLIARHSAVWGVDSLDERLAVTAEAQRMARASGDVVSLLWGYLFNSIAMYEAGDSPGTARASDAFDEQARQSGMPYFHWVAAIWRVGRALREGQFAEAEALLPTLGGDSQALVAVYFRALFTFLLYRDQGRLTEPDALLRAVIDLAGQTPGSFDQHRGHIAQALRLLLLADTGRVDEARAHLAGFAGGDVASLPRDAYWLATVALLGEVSVAVADRERATMLYDMLLPYAGRNVAPASSFVSFGAAAYYLARMTTLLGRREDAERHFAAALELNARMHARPAVVWTQIAFADLLVQRAASGDWERARAMLDQALATSRELGMSARAAQAEGLLAMLDALARPARQAEALPYGLSPREIDVLRLLVAGHTDREIGDALYISPRTVTTHVSNIFGKLNVNSRTEAAAFAVRQALV